MHFPTGRVSMEGAIRLLVDDFAVPTATELVQWRPLLAASEAAFLDIAHQPGVSRDAATAGPPVSSRSR
jgi:hypothetical protein